MTDQKIRTLKQARQAALRGEIDHAILALSTFADRGDASASASLAEIFAFRADWVACMHHAGALICAPRSVYAGNVFDDMIRLLGRSGHETNDWGRVAHLAQEAIKRIEDNLAGDPPAKQEAYRKRYSTILNALHAYAQRSGEPPHELVAIFGGIASPQAERDTAFENAIRRINPLWPENRERSQTVSRRIFKLAQMYKQYAQGIVMYEQGDMPAEFDCAFFVAKAYVTCHNVLSAWRVLWEHMDKWHPVDAAQVAPISLITDSDLAGIVTPERCEQILALPRALATHL